MTDKTEQDIARAARAQTLLDDPLLAEGFDKLKAEYLTAWMSTTPLEGEQRERLWYAHRVVDLVRKHLTTVVSDGKIARHELEALRR